MKSFYTCFFLFSILLIIPLTGSAQQNAGNQPKAELIYFHPTERCPIDQTIEDQTRKMMQTDYAGQIREGTLKFRVINTDDKNQAQVVSRFEINAQALYLVSYVNTKEIKNDLTEFAFSTAQSNPARFKAGLKEEISKVLKVK